jgi:propanol-preferring alcohol dehydrogenase
MGVETYVSTRSKRNIECARSEGARWAANAAEEEIPCKLDAAILFPPVGNLVEPILAQLGRGGVMVMAPVSASPIRIKNYSENLWGRDIRTLYNLSRADADAFFEIVDRLELEVETRLFSFEDLPDALILVRQGRLEHPNAVIKVSDWPD